MKTLKRTLALIAALTVVATSMAACKKDDKSSSSTKDSGSKSSSDSGSKSDSESTGTPSGKAFTIVTWNDSDFPALINAYTKNWDGVDAEAAVAVAKLSKQTPDGVDIKFSNLKVGSGEVSAVYDQMLTAGDPIDIYAAEADFILNYVNDDNKSLDLSELGFDANSWPEAYAYTLAIGTSDTGKIKAQSWQACAGAYAYRADLAEEYLGVKSPSEMQAKVKDWATFEATGKTLASEHKIALAATLGGIWQVFSPARSTAWVKDGKLVAEDTKTDEFLDMAKRMVTDGSVTTTAQWSDAWFALGTEDKALGYFVSTWGLGDTIIIAAAGGSGADSHSFGKWALTEGPQGFFWGGTWMMVNPKTEFKTQVTDFYKAVTIDTDTMTQYSIKKGELVNNKAANTAAAADDSVKTTKVTENFGGQDYYAILSKGAAQIAIKPENLSRYDAAIKAQFINAVGDYANGDLPDKAAVYDSFKQGVAGNVSGVTVE